jgi:hypothetical protein
MSAFILTANSVSSQSRELIRLRQICSNIDYHEPSDILEQLEKINTNGPLMEGYKSISLLMQSRTSASPFNKIKYFRRGTAMLDYSVSADLTCIELRYLRFCVQTTVPSFLRYSSHIEEDKQFIIQNWSSLSDFDLKERIRTFLLRSGYCNITEKKSLSNG